MTYAQRLWSMRHALGLLVVMQTFDTLSTVLALQVGGVEANPLVRLGFEAQGGAFLVLVKWAVIALVFFAVWIDPLEKPYVPAAVIIMNGVYALVIAGNFLAYARLTGEWPLAVAYWGLVAALAVAAVEHVRSRPDPAPS